MIQKNRLGIWKTVWQKSLPSEPAKKKKQKKTHYTTQMDAYNANEYAVFFGPGCKGHVGNGEYDKNLLINLKTS